MYWFLNYVSFFFLILDSEWIQKYIGFTMIDMFYLLSTCVHKFGYKGLLKKKAEIYGK